MKKINSFLIMIIIFTISCKEKEPTAPTADPPTEVLAEATIGPNGGELKTEDFSLSVPAGTFQSEITLSLSISDEDSPFGESTVSSIYRVMGIPEEFNNTIRIAVKYSGALSDSTYLAVGEPLYESAIEDVYFLIPAYDSSGYLVSNLVLDENSAKSLYKNNLINSELEDIIIGITGEDVFISGFLQIYYPKYISELSVETLADTLNSVILQFGKNNLDLIDPGDLYKHKLLEVAIRDYSDYIITSKNGIFNIDVDLLGSTKLSLAKIKFAGSYLKHVIYEYVGSDNYLLTQYNMYNALTLYLEHYLGYSSDNNPPTGIGGEPTEIEEEKLHGLLGYELSLFDGFSLEIYPGLCSLIKYLVDFQDYKISNLGLVFNNGHKKNINHYFSLISKVESLIMDWFPDYYEKYVIGEIYTIDNSVFLNQKNLGGTWNIDLVYDPSDTIETFTSNYNDLSAKRYFIELDHEFENESTSLTLDAYKSSAANNDGVAILVFGVDDNYYPQHLITGRAEQVEIQNLKGFYQNGTKKFLVVVVNCINNGVDYTGQTEIDLVAKIKSNGETGWDVSKSNRCLVKINIEGHMKEVKAGTTNEYDMDLGAGVNAAIGSFSGNTFVGDWNNDYDSFNFNYTGTVTVTLNDELTMVTSVDWTEDYTSKVDGNTVFTSTYSFTGKNLPLYSEHTPGVFQITGSQTCANNHLSNVIYTARNYASSADISLKDKFCNEYSYITISFWKE